MQKINATEEKTNKIKKMLKIIVENLILDVKDIHIRIEDCGVTIPKTNYSYGFVIKSASLEPTNEKFVRDFIDPEIRKKEKISYSLTNVLGVSIYMNMQGGSK